MERNRAVLPRLTRLSILILAAAAFFLAITKHTDAHKPVTSKYDYNKDVFPLLREHCSGCHVEGGPGPMSLMTYKDAVPWAESIRDELTSGRMPPWPIDPTSPAVKGGHPISSRDLDMIVVWASGGTPEGDPDAKLPPVPANSQQWKLGPPDLKIPMDSEQALAAGTLEKSAELLLTTNLTGARWVKAVDLLPGNASIVRDAVISIENGPVLALWEPGTDPITVPSGSGFQLPPGSKIRLQIHYKKHFDQEQDSVSDKSTVGLYFTDPPPAHELESLRLDLAHPQKLTKAMRIVAVRAVVDRGYESANIDAVSPSGNHIPLLHLRGPRPQWPRRYWLQEPVELASGSEINVNFKLLSDYSEEPKTSRQSPIELNVEYLPQ
jgi:hypothetical protein